MGRMKTVRRTIVFFLFFEKKGKSINRTAETTVKGVWGTQSSNIPERIKIKEPGLSV